jgi:hypothetical protein
MNLDIDFLTNFFEKYTKSRSRRDLEEQDAAATSSSAPSGGSGKTPKKWESGAAHGPANPLQANSLDYMVKRRKLGPTGMYDPKHKWVSGRQMGKTGGSDFA